MPTPLFFVPVLSTLLGGVLAIRFRRWNHGLLATGAGVLLGAAFLDLLPEALSLGTTSAVSGARVLSITLLSFLIFFVIESALDTLSTGPDARVPKRSIGRVAGGLMVFHSLRDGMAMGAAFTASHTAGYAVALGIAAHDLGDGMNTILLTTGGEKPRTVDFLFLGADALAPVVGWLVAVRWFSSAGSSAILLAVAAGFFIQMAGSDFLPEVRRSHHTRRYAVPCVLGGAGLIYAANALLGRM